jgi:hypothetical protein
MVTLLPVASSNCGGEFCQKQARSLGVYNFDLCAVCCGSGSYKESSRNSEQLAHGVFLLAILPRSATSLFDLPPTRPDQPDVGCRAPSHRSRMSAIRSLSGVERTRRGQSSLVEIDPTRTLALWQYIRDGSRSISRSRPSRKMLSLADSARSF